MAVPVVESTGAVRSVGSSSTIILAKPSGVVSGELMIAVLGKDGTAAPSVIPSGWTAIREIAGSQAFNGAYWKEAGGSEPADYTWTLPGSETNGGVIYRISGHNSTTPIDVSGTNTGGADSAPVSPSITTTEADTLLIACFAIDGKTLTTDDTGYPSGYTGVYSTQHGTTGACASGSAYKANTSSGATGTATFDTTGISDNWAAIHLAIAPAAAGGGTRPQGPLGHPFKGSFGGPI